GLPEEQVRVSQAGHGAVVVQERVGSPVVLVGEDPAVGDVGHAPAAVVDVDVVMRAGGERIEVRPAVGLFERDPVRDEGDRARPSNEPISYGNSWFMVLPIRAWFTSAAGFRRSRARFSCTME